MYFCKVTIASASSKAITSENPSYIRQLNVFSISSSSFDLLITYTMKFAIPYVLGGRKPGCWVPGVGVTGTVGPWYWSDLYVGSLVLE